MKTAFRLALLGCALSFAAAGAAAAQSQTSDPASDSQSMQAPHKAPDPQHQTARLTRLLQLTPDQAAKIEPILQSRDQQIEQLHSEGAGGGHGKMRAIMQDSNAQVQAILTDSQKQKYQQVMQQAMQRRQARKNSPASSSSSGGDGE